MRSSWTCTLQGDVMGMLKRSHKRSQFPARLLSLLLIPLLFLSSCKGFAKDLPAEFKKAVEQENYPLAADLYREASIGVNFNEEVYNDIVKNKAGEIVRRYRMGEISFDRADLSLKALEFSDKLSQTLKESLEEAKHSVAPGESSDEALERAKLYAEAGDYKSSLESYDRILEKFPEKAEARRAYATVLGEYIEEAEKQSRELEKEGYLRTAIMLMDRVLEFDPDNQALISRRDELKASVAKKEKEIKAAVPRYELNLFLEKGDLEGAKAYLETVKDKAEDIEGLETLYQESVDTYVEKLISSASAYAVEDRKGRWSESPSARALAAIREGLAMFPDNEALLKAEKSQLNMQPYNVVDKVQNSYGAITRGGSGSSAGGYYYDGRGFDRAILTKPDVSFSYTNTGYAATRILITPQSSDPGNYDNLSITVQVDGAAVYSGNPFADSAGVIDLKYNLNTSSTVKITVRQSGFASFFESIMGRNNLFFEMYLLPWGV